MVMRVHLERAISEGAASVAYEEGGGICVRESRFAPGLAIQEHVHATAYLCITLAGSVRDTIAGRESDATPGYACFVPPDTPHANRFGHRGARCLLFEVSSESLSALAASGGEMDVARPWSCLGGPIAWRALALYAKLRGRAFTALDLEEFAYGTFDRRSARTPKRAAPPAWLARVKEMLDADLRNPPRLSALAAEAAVHETHLLREFRAHSGCSPGTYLQTRRVAVACGLLLDTAIPLVQIAHHVGFYDQPHFTRVFKSRIGVTPAAYRNVLAAPVR